MGWIACLRSLGVGIGIMFTCRVIGLFLVFAVLMRVDMKLGARVWFEVCLLVGARAS
jgi:hypothetical protein